MDGQLENTIALTLLDPQSSWSRHFDTIFKVSRDTFLHFDLSCHINHVT
jgi:hypothetical protein